MKSLNIADIARIAGVSKATVSRVLNNPELVSEDTKLKVQSVIKENEYFPKYEARALSYKQSVKVIAVLINEINNEYFGNLLYGISEIAGKNNITTMIFNTDNSFKKEIEILKTLRGYYFGGLIYTPSIRYYDAEKEKKILKYFDKFNVPVVVVDRTMRDRAYPGVFFDDYRAINDATKAFIERGHQNIGIVSGDFEGYLISTRENAVVDALSEAGLSLAKDNHLKCNYTVESAYEVVKERFSKENPPTAMILSNNKIALGFMKAINELGLSINQDVDCVGIDKIPALDYVNYGYSFIERDSTIMGREAMQLLMNQMNQSDKEYSVFLQAPLHYLPGGRSE